MSETVFCGKCEIEFTCGRKTDKCWCVELTIDENNLNFLNSNYEGCLCPDCLSVYALKE